MPAGGFLWLLIQVCHLIIPRGPHCTSLSATGSRDHRIFTSIIEGYYSEVPAVIKKQDDTSLMFMCKTRISSYGREYIEQGY